MFFSSSLICLSISIIPFLGTIALTASSMLSLFFEPDLANLWPSVATQKLLGSKNSKKGHLNNT